MTETRRLAAITAIDVVGYSRLMGEDEPGTARAVREHREAARPLVTGRGGRVVKTMGDGQLLEFPSVVDAVECAIAIQSLMVERNAGTADNKRIVYRVGVNLGDVLIEGDDILGDGVNIAARLEGICRPGGVLISATAYDHVRGRIDADFVDLGDKDLKNIARPVRVYAVKVGSGSPAPAPSASTPMRQGPPRLSIVVLPLVNMSGDPEQDYFVDGVTESLTTDLSRMRACLVIGRNTAFTYKGKAVDLREIGRELNVRYVLEGSVQRASDQMRISVQLIDAESGNHLWAERFDKPFGELFRMQDEIVARLANQLGVELASAETRRSRSAPNPDSFDLVCQGWACNYKGPTLENLSQARAFFERALALDPQNVEALVQTASVDFQFAEYLFSEDRASRLARAEAALLQAIRFAPDHAGAHLALGPVLCVTGRAWDGIAECEWALAIDQNLAAAHGAIAAFKIHVGRAEETEAHVREALRLSPRDSAAFHWLMFVGGANLVLGRYEEAIVWLERSITANRNNPLCHFHLAGTFAGLGRLEEAQAAARAGLALNPQFTVARFRAASAGYHAGQAGRHERFAEELRKAGVPEG